jgi:hypothetical protein
VLLSWLKVLNDNKIQTVGDLLFVGNVGEEELGNLRGIKAVFRDNLDIDGMVGLEPAPDGTVLMLGTGSHRYEVTFKGPGGHSFGAFGQVPSAIHGMGRAIAKIADVRTPTFPKTTFTVGTVGGGTSVNTIAPDARMAVDIRSDEMAPLLETEKKILAAIDEAVVEENKRWNVNTLSVSTKLIGDRPGGRTQSDTVIVEAATRSNSAFGHKTLLTGASTDANVPMSLGIPAIIVGGGGKTGGFHALSEWIDVTDGWKGAQNSLVTVLGLVGVQGTSAAAAGKTRATHQVRRAASRGLSPEIRGLSVMLVALLRAHAFQGDHHACSLHARRPGPARGRRLGAGQQPARPVEGKGRRGRQPIRKARKAAPAARRSATSASRCRPIGSSTVGNAAGVLQYCVKNNYLGGDAASVKDKLMAKITGQKPQETGFASGAKGLLKGGDGQDAQHEDPVVEGQDQGLRLRAEERDLADLT